MMSWRPLAALAVALPLLAGCSGTDAVRAQQLLQQAQQAQQRASSETFSAHLNVTTHGQSMELDLSGGGYMKGSHAGDMYMDMRLSAPVTMPFSTVRIAKVGASQWVELDGKRMALPSGSVQSGSTSTSVPSSALAAFDFTRYVKDVKVQGGQTLNGRAVTKIVGVLDTASLLGAFSKLGALSQSTGASVPDFGGHVTDTRVVAYVDDQTHMLVAALADVSVHASGGDAKLHLDVAITSVNRPVALPSA
jgi:hypothetical protein